MILHRSALVVLATLLTNGFGSAQVRRADPVAEPPRPEKVDLQIRYRIRADRDERVRQFRVLEKYLIRLGFDDARKNDPDRDLDILDPTAERFTGTIPSKNVLDVLADPRVMNILFAPVGYPFPDSGDKPVSVRIIIRSGLLPREQQVLYDQTLAQLDLLGFRDALGYDTRGYTQIKGTLPFKNLPRLIKDLRHEPSGWFLADTTQDRLPRPFGDQSPIRWVEVMPPVQVPAPLVPEVLLPARAKLSPELRALLVDPAMKETPIRVVVLFNREIEESSEALRTLLASGFGQTVQRNADGSVIKGADGLPALTDGAALDGAIGNIASIRFDRPSDAERFATADGVLTVRLQRPASETTVPMTESLKPTAAAEILKSSGVESLHRLGYTGSGVKVVLVGTDFAGAEKLIGNGLPRSTQLVDLTTELNPNILPSPAFSDRSGNGIAAARAFALAAPDAELVLIRVDPGAVFQLFSIIRLARGETAISDALRSRLTDITIRSVELSRRRDAAVTEYREAFNDLADDDKAVARRKTAKAALEAVSAAQDRLSKRVERLNAFHKQLVTAISGTRVVVNTLEWESGFPLDAVSQLSRTLEQMAVPSTRITRSATARPSAARQPLVWVQASSMAGAQVWGGPFVDANNNGTMEFARPTQQLPPGNWTAEMNFLGLQSPSGMTTAELPSGAKLRFSMQWREPIDPNVPAVDRPIYPVVLQVFKQLDPKGEKQPSDEMAEVARTVAGPYPILVTRTAVVYEQILDFTTPAEGNYALVVATGYKPAPLLPALRREAEIQPRLIVETLSSRPGENRAVFRSYTNSAAGVGIPGDSAGVITVGTGALGELTGGGTGLTLRAKPDLFAAGALDVAPTSRGTGIAAGFVGGIAAELVQAGAAGANPFQSSGAQRGKPVAIPEGWMRFLRPIPRMGQ